MLERCRHPAEFSPARRDVFSARAGADGTGVWYSGYRRDASGAGITDLRTVRQNENRETPHVMLLRIAQHYFPVPDIGNCCGLLGSLSLMNGVPLIAPVSSGANSTWTAQLCPGPKVAEHLHWRSLRCGHR